jgi:SAM-dependent methyltransferase
MLTVARWNGIDAPLVCGDLRRLPFTAAFAGVLCLESPLAYLLDDDDFIMALRSIRRALLPRGRVVIDVYDYVGMFWPGAMGWMRTSFGSLRIAESHNYDELTRMWTMEQRIAVDETGRTRRFRLRHVLKVRAPDEYAAALERSGFEIREMLDGYPNSQDKRLLIVAVAR